MTLLNNGKNRIRDLVATDISTGEVGTGSTAVDVTDTDLETPVSGTQNTASTTTSSKQIMVDYTLPATEGNGSDVTEFGVWTNSDATLLSRFVFSSITKSSVEEWQFSVVYKIV